MKQILVVLLAFCLIQASVYGDGFESFVRNKIIEYPAWLLENYLDPSPAMNTSFTIADSGAITRFKTNISYMVVRGHANTHVPVSIDLDLAAGSFNVTLNVTSRHKFSGYHKTNGTILTNPVEADGYWEVFVGSTQILFDMKFDITSSGYLDLVQINGGRVYLPEEPADVYFQGVTDSEVAQGYEEFVRTSLYKGFRTYIQFGYNYLELDPIRATYLRYWREVLSRTTFAELIGTTDIPTTSGTQPTEISSTEPSSTTSPCAKVRNTEFTYKDEEVLETFKGVDNDGIPVTWTRVVALKKQRHEL